MHKEEKPIPVDAQKAEKAGTIMTHRVRETCFCRDLRRQRYRADRLLTITEENVEKIKCRSDTDHREETQL